MDDENNLYNYIEKSENNINEKDTSQQENYFLSSNNKENFNKTSVDNYDFISTKKKDIEESTKTNKNNLTDNISNQIIFYFLRNN